MLGLPATNIASKRTTSTSSIQRRAQRRFTIKRADEAKPTQTRLSALSAHRGDEFCYSSESPNVRPQAVRGAAAGVAFSSATSITGIDHFVHEQGHVQSANLFYTFSQGDQAPRQRFQVDAFDQINEEGVLSQLWQPRDMNSDGAAAWARPRQGINGQTALGLKVGQQTSDAYISLAGSIPDLAISGAMAAVATRQIATRPGLAAGLMTAAVLRQTSTIGYALSAATANEAQLQFMAVRGHDFAKASSLLSTSTAIGAMALADLFAAFSILYVPVVVLASWFGARSHKKRLLLTDSAIFDKWLASQVALGKDLNDCIKEYPRIGSLEHILERFSAGLAKDPDSKRLRTRWLRAQLGIEFARLQRYVVNRMPKKERTSIKKSLQEEFKQAQKSNKVKPNRYDQVKTYVLMALTTITSILGLIVALGLTIVPALVVAAPVLAVMIPVMGIVGLGFAAYDALKVMRSSLPKLIKGLAVGSAFASSLSLVGSLIAVLVPGGVFAAIGIIAIGAMGRYVCNRIMQRKVNSINADSQPQPQEAPKVLTPEAASLRWRNRSVGLGFGAVTLGLLSFIPGAFLITIPLAAAALGASIVCSRRYAKSVKQHPLEEISKEYVARYKGGSHYSGSTSRMRQLYPDNHK